eukprot:scaffold203640_cov32-Tisochrysis_lutea.AAC.3
MIIRSPLHVLTVEMFADAFADRTRQSITMRVYDSAWGRIVTPEATDTEETPARLPPRRSRRHASTRARVPKLATASAC